MVEDTVLTVSEMNQRVAAGLHLFVELMVEFNRTHVLETPKTEHPKSTEFRELQEVEVGSVQFQTLFIDAATKKLAERYKIVPNESYGMPGVKRFRPPLVTI